ncbi:MAG: hypothetical protein JSW17_01320, partial [Candidatus Omnitrophota bacterium]
RKQKTSENTGKSHYIKAHGCQINEQDSENIDGNWVENGYELSWNSYESEGDKENEYWSERKKSYFFNLDTAGRLYVAAADLKQPSCNPHLA